MTCRPGRCIAILSILLALWFAAGCEIAEPKLPTFTTQVNVPLGEERLDVADALDDEDFLTELDGHTLGFTVDGDPDTVSLDFDLSADISAQSIVQSLGAFSLDLGAPVDVDFTLAQLYPPAAALHGTTVPVPPFPLVQTSDAEDIEDVESAALSAGTLVVTVHNGLPVPIGADSGPDQLVLELVDPASGDAFATVVFDVIAPLADASRTADLAGVNLPGAASVRLTGGSPGSGGVPVLVDAATTIVVSAVFQDLEVTQAVAAVPAQSFTSSLHHRIARRLRRPRGRGRRRRHHRLGRQRDEHPLPGRDHLAQPGGPGRPAARRDLRPRARRAGDARRELRRPHRPGAGRHALA